MTPAIGMFTFGAMCDELDLVAFEVATTGVTNKLF